MTEVIIPWNSTHISVAVHPNERKFNRNLILKPSQGSTQIYQIVGAIFFFFALQRTTTTKKPNSNLHFVRFHFAWPLRNAFVVRLNSGWFFKFVGLFVSALFLKRNVCECVYSVLLQAFSFFLLRFFSLFFVFSPSVSFVSYSDLFFLCVSPSTSIWSTFCARRPLFLWAPALFLSPSLSVSIFNFLFWSSHQMCVSCAMLIWVRYKASTHTIHNRQTQERQKKEKRNETKSWNRRESLKEAERNGYSARNTQQEHEENEEKKNDSEENCLEFLVCNTRKREKCAHTKK